MEIQIIKSEDGSDTLFNPALNETYHSTKGALKESIYVYLEKGLHEFDPAVKPINILEVGFGTGLNALLTLKEVAEKGYQITYHTLEPFPLTKEVYENLNYGKLPELEKYAEHMQHIHQLEEAKESEPVKGFKITKFYKKLEDYFPSETYDLIYFDAFAPSKQPEIWSLNNLTKTYSVLNPGGLLTTYCAQGQFKRDLKSAGFDLKTLPGPLGKMEMTRGWKK